MSYTEQILLVPSADHTPIHASLLGSPALPALVLLHGQSMSSIVFDCIFSTPEYLEHVCLVRYDVRGHGRSGRPSTEDPSALTAFFSSQNLASDFDAVICAFSLPPHTVVLAAWSIGGTLLPDILAHARTPLRGAVLICGVPYMSSVPLVATPAILHPLMNGLLSTDDVALANRTMLQTIELAVADPGRDMPYRLRATWAGDAVGQAPRVKAGYLLRKQEESERVFRAQGEEGCEILVLHGEKDSQIEGRKVVEVLKGVVGKRVSECALQGVGHAPFLEAPERFRKGVLGFVERVLKEGST